MADNIANNIENNIENNIANKIGNNIGNKINGKLGQVIRRLVIRNDDAEEPQEQLHEIEERPRDDRLTRLSHRCAILPKQSSAVTFSLPNRC